MIRWPLVAGFEAQVSDVSGDSGDPDFPIRKTVVGRREPDWLAPLDGEAIAPCPRLEAGKATM